jgi:glycosyltransferase involved in cell wall biosynthesis
MVLTVLSVAYPFAPVGPDTAGGAEQVLATLDQALVDAGHKSLVVARNGSRVAGTLLPIPVETGDVDDAARARAYAACSAILKQEVMHRHVDLVHMHGVDFYCYLPPPRVTVLVTLHLPIAWYPPQALHTKRPSIFFNCVSASQHRDAGIAGLLPPIENGIDLKGSSGRHAKRGFAFMLARICPEKGVHLALDAANQAGVPLLVAGEVFPYAEHRSYFLAEVMPRLDKFRRYIGPVGSVRKRRLLSAARCVLVASTVPETSSLVAREALAAGTPVIAFARGALVDTLEHGRTGFLVDDVAGMALAIGRSAEIDREVCRSVALERFAAGQMIARYFRLYRALADLRVP